MRAQDALAAVILLVASLAFVLGIGLVGWILAIAEAVIAIVVATTGFHIADRIRRNAVTRRRIDPGSSDLEAPVPAAVEEQRLPFGRVAELDDAADDDHVVAGVVLGDGLAVDER